MHFALKKFAWPFLVVVRDSRVCHITSSPDENSFVFYGDESSLEPGQTIETLPQPSTNFLFYMQTFYANLVSFWSIADSPKNIKGRPAPSHPSPAAKQSTIHQQPNYTKHTTTTHKVILYKASTAQLHKFTFAQEQKQKQKKAITPVNI